MGRWIDISMAITDGLRTNHSRPGEEVRISYDVDPAKHPEQRKTVRRVSARLHTGTHVDGPEHLVSGGRRLDQIPVENFVGRAWVVDMYHKVPRGVITAADLDAAIGGKAGQGDILLLRTGWNSHYSEPDFFSDSPWFDPRAAEWCIGKGLKMVAIDFLADPIAAEQQTEGPDAFKRRVLAAGILVMTNADNVDRIRSEQVTLYAFPLKIVPSEAGLTRAVVWED